MPTAVASLMRFTLFSLMLMAASLGCTSRQPATSESEEGLEPPEVVLPGQDQEASAGTDALDAKMTDVPQDNDKEDREVVELSDGDAAPEEVLLGTAELTAGIPGDGPLTVDQITGWLEDPRRHAPLKVRLPLGLSAAEEAISGLQENPITRAKIELGRQLYFDPRLSADGTISCASCHDPAEGYSRNMPVGVGIRDQKGTRNSPVSFNRILSSAQFWDGRAPSLEEQAKGPIANPIEMGNTHEKVVESLQKIPGYQVQFDAIFPGKGITIDTVAQAIAAYERNLVTGPTPYDYLEIVRSVESQYDAEELAELAEDDPELDAQYREAKKAISSLSESAIRGRDLFFTERANCTACHAGANFTDEKYHNIGVGMDQPEPDLGRFVVSQADIDRGAFKTPTLRNIARSGPYMHDGSQKTLEEVVEWYVKGGHPNPHLSDKIKKLDLNEQEKQDLVAFMNEGLSGQFPAVRQDRLPE